MLRNVITMLLAEARAGLAVIEAVALTTWTWLQAQPLWLGAVIAASTIVLLVAAVMLVRRAREQARRVSKARARASASRENRTTVSIRRREPVRDGREAPASTRQAPGRMTPAASASEARELVRHGVPAIEISRRTGLARDAVSLLLAQTGREARKGRPTAAGLAAQAGGTGMGIPFDVRA